MHQDSIIEEGRICLVCEHSNTVGVVIDENHLVGQPCFGCKMNCSLPYHKQEIDTCKNSYPSIIFILQTWIFNQMVMLMFVYIKTRCTALCKHLEPRLISFIACV